MEEKYLPAEIEKHVQGIWAEKDVYRVTEDKNKKKFYACSMLPYPSGNLHMGHVRNYTINDTLTRFLRMKGYNVLMPMGWDAFGLPAENAAMRSKVPPAKWTYQNIAYMKAQMQGLGLAIDWTREIATCDPEYYRWNQWLFLKMLEHGIAERRTQVVNWDPVDMTVLANEQVIEGRGWRSGALVEKREIPGYYLRISDYADELNACVADPENPNYLKNWPSAVRLMQENWIGKSQGVRFAFTHDIRDAAGELIQDGRMFVFTTRADTIMGVTFCAVAPEHPLASHAAQNNAALAAFIAECKKGGVSEADLAARDKEGMPTGLFVQHPLTGNAVEIWVGNYVLMSYGDGAVMGVPAHDERDFEFVKKYGIPIKQVIAVDGEAFDSENWQDWYTDAQRGVCVNSGVLDGLNHEAAVNKVAEMLEAQGLGDKKTTFRLRDWGISRQRYWGTPIPIIHCEDCGAVPVPEKDLPVVLPEDLVPDGSGNPLNKCETFLKVDCPCCGKPARRETDTMDTFVDSSWYFMRYCDAHNPEAMVGEGTNYWMPMDQYIGGVEHAILHLLYARFWTRVMRDLKLVDFDEPFDSLLTQGMVLNHIFTRQGANGVREYVPLADIDFTHNDEGKIIGGVSKVDGKPVNYDGIGTMSKSKYNGVDPNDLIQQYGADTARFYTMFTSPPDATLEWSDFAVEGAYRFLRRVWNYGYRHQEQIVGAQQLTSFAQANADVKALRYEIYQVLQQVEFDYQRMQYNTVASGAMKILNALEGIKLDAIVASDKDVVYAALREGMSILLRVLYPIAPHVCCALWERLAYQRNFGDLLDVTWPEVDASALIQDEVELMLQVNGKLRGSIVVSKDADKAQMEAIALESEAFQRFAKGASAKRVIVVPGRLVNIVI